MRPRSKLLSKRRLQLPTIKEGSEETLRDANHTNASLLLSAHQQALSSQDYLLSIRHLAHPTFSAPPSGDARGVGRKSSQVRGGGGGDGGGGGERTPVASDPLEFLYGGGPALSTCWEGDSEERRRRRMRGGRTCGGGQSAEGSLSGHRGDEDDRDTREGRHRTRANSVPRLTRPNCPHRRKASCPELHPSSPQTPGRTPAPSPGGLTDAHFKGRVEEEEEEEEGGGGRGEREGTGEGPAPGGKPSLISQWLSECKAVWRGTRVKACLLPAIDKT